MAELERKIDALTATLHAQKAGGPEIKHHGGLPQHDGNTPAAAMSEGAFRMGTLSHDWSTPTANRYSDIPPGYGPAQTIQRGPETKRRKLNDTMGDNQGVGCPSLLTGPLLTNSHRRYPMTWTPSTATLPSIPR